MATASCAPGLRPELGAATGATAVSSVSELVLWGPTQEPASREGRGANPNPRAWPPLSEQRGSSRS